MPGHDMVSGALIRNFVLSLALSFLTLAPLHSQWTRQPFLFSFHFVCMFVFFYFLSIWFSPWVCFVLSSVSRVVITACSSLVNFLRICVITPCYIITFVMFCYLLYSKLI